MSMYLKRLMIKHRLMEAAGDDGSANGDGGSAGAGEGGEGNDGAGAKGAKTGDGGSDDSSKVKPTDAEAKLLKEVMNKKTALKAAEDKLKEFDGIDPVKARAAIEAQRLAEQQALEAKGDWDRLKEQMASAHTGEKAALQAGLDEARVALDAAQATIAELTVGAAFSQSAFIKDEVALTPNKARAVYGSHFAFEDGNIVAFDKPAGSVNRTPLVDANGNALNFEAALRKLVELDPDRDEILRSKVKSGAGSKTTSKTATFKEPENVGYGHSKISAALKAAGGIIS